MLLAATLAAGLLLGLAAWRLGGAERQRRAASRLYPPLVYLLVASIGASAAGSLAEPRLLLESLAYTASTAAASLAAAAAVARLAGWKR